MANGDFEADLKVGVNTLLDSLKDKDGAVIDSIHKSLCKIATGRNASNVVSICCNFRISKRKLESDHVANIFRVLEQICMQHGEFLESDIVTALIDITIKEMILSNDYVPLIQMPASGILVAIGNYWCAEVIEPLGLLVKPGTIPHYTVIHTLGTLAATNINGTVPFIKPILGKMLPTLGMIKQDPLKQAFSYGLGHFSTALIDYFGNNENQDNDLKKNNFSTEISIAFDVLFIHWLHSSEPKVVENVLEAMGPMFSLLPVEKMKELIPKLIPAITALYKKSNIDSYYVTQALTLMLIESVKEENSMTVTLIETIIHAMFHLILTSPDYDQPQKIKNHFELLRCFDILVTNFSDCVLEYLFQQTKNNNEEERMKAIVVLTHLITSSEISVKNIIGRFTIVLKAMILTEHNLKMKRILLKAIVALAYRRYLEQKDDAVLLDFIIRQCSNDITHAEKYEQSNLTNDCENSLYLLSSTVPDIKPSLWPLLIKALLNYDNNEALSIISRCLTQLVSVEHNHENEIIVPSNESVYVRSLSLLINYKNKKMVQNLILFLSNYCEYVHKDLKVSWEMDLQKLTTYLDSNDFCLDTWESLILDLFRSAIYLVNDNKWINVVLHKILEQIPKNEKFVHRKGILYKFLAILLCHVVDTQTIGYTLDILFNSLHNSLSEESKHLARALGIISIKHGLCIVEKLDTLAREVDSKKSNRFLNFNFMKNAKHESDVNNLKYSITLCYGEVAKEVLDENVLLRLVGSDVDGHGGGIRWSIAQLRHSSHPPALTHAALNTVELLAKAIRSIPQCNIILHDRWNLVNLVLDQMFEQTIKTFNIELYPPVIKATTSLILLPKHLAPEERNLILRTVCGKVYNSVSFLKTKFESSEEEHSNDVFAKTLNDSLCSLNTLIKEFMLQTVCPSTLDDVLSILDEWIDNENEQIRTAAVRSVQVALICFIQNVKLTYENPSRFGQAGLIMGKMVPRCADISSIVRYTAIDCVKILIQIIDLYEGRAIDQNCDIFKSLDEIQCDIGTNDPEKFSVLISHLANIISDRVPHQQTIQLIESLLSGLYGDEMSGIGCNIVLSNLIKSKGQDLHQNVYDVMDNILATLLSVEGNVRDGLLKAMLTLTKHHAKAVVTYLLLQPLPFEKSVNDCWRSLSHDVSVAAMTIDQLNQILLIEPLFEESLKYDNGRVVAVQTLAAISALCEMFSQAEVKSICIEKFNEIFSMLYTILACFIGADAPAHAALSSHKNDKFGFVPNHQATKLSPARIVLETLKYFLINANYEKAAEACLQCTQLESGDHLNSFLDMVTYLVEVFCKDYPQRLVHVVSTLNVYSRATFIPQRIAVVAFFNRLVTFRCNDNMVLLESVMATLSTGWKDTALEVRAISLSGLSNIRYLREDQQEHYLSIVISALYNGLDDYQGSTLRTNIPLVSMIGLNGLLTLPLNKDKPMSSLPPISQRIKSFFNTENPVLREASVQLFGDLVSTKASDDLREQALALFPCFLLHLADDDSRVIKACKQTLKKISPLFGAQKTNNMIQNHLIDSAKLHLVDFTIDLMKNASAELPKSVPQFIENTFNYLNSPWDNIRANAALVIGVLFSSYSSTDENYEDNKKLLMSRLLQLMKDSNPRVRASTATAMSSLYNHNPVKNEISK